MQTTRYFSFEEDHALMAMYRQDFLMAMHRHNSLMAMQCPECQWGDMLDELQYWNMHVAKLYASAVEYAPAVDMIAAVHNTPKKRVTFADSSPNISCITSSPVIEPYALIADSSSQKAYYTSSVSIVPDKEPLTDLVAPPLPSTNAIKTIIARNLPRTISTEELRERFQLYGVVRDVYLPKNKDVTSCYYGSIRGFALIKYESATQSERAIRMLSILGLTIHGKKVTVEFSKADTPDRT